MTHSASKTTVGLIGCGKRLANVIQHMARHPAFQQIELPAVYDPDPHYANVLRKTLAPGLSVKSHYEDILGDPANDWIMIGSWNCFHAEHVIAAFNAGKHVFCEKPLATTLTDCVAMREAWKHSNCRFVIGFTLRYSPHYRKIKELMDDGRIGELISFEFNETIGFDHGGLIMGGWRCDRQ